MLKLSPKQDPQRIVLLEAVASAKGRKAEPEAFVIMAPITPAMRRRAMSAALRTLGKVEDINDVGFDLLADSAEVGSRELIRLGVMEWGGIGDADGNQIDLAPDRDTRMRTANDADRPTGTIDLLLDDEAIFQRIETQYVLPDNLRRAEKNGLPASLNGIGEVATRAKITADSPANRKARRAAAKNALTSKTRSAPKRAKGSGTR